MKTASVRTNGICVNLLEAGEGPLVMLLHGFPELSLSWRRQISVLADAGYRVVAPDQRGNGQRDRPENSDEYTLSRSLDDHQLGWNHHESAAGRSLRAARLAGLTAENETPANLPLRRLRFGG